MGFLGRLFGTDPTVRAEKAQRFLERGQFNEARWELEGLDHPQAEAMMALAHEGLAKLNLEEAKARFSSGDVVGAKEHMEMARQFGADPTELRQVRRLARQVREEARAAKAAAKVKPTLPEGADPLWSLPPDDPRLRYAMLLEAWPEDLRERLAALGPDFARAVLLVEGGKGGEAFEQLTPFAQQEPAARYERARAALQAGKLPAAASDLRTFGDEVGHRRIGPVHTAVMLTQTLARLGRSPEALEALNKEIAVNDEIALRGTRASLLEGMGRVEEAGKEAEALLLTAPRDQGLYRLLARTREALGNRVGAMAALEGCLAKTCSNPGKCGQQPFDVQAARMLARLYLEDRIEPKRAQELLHKLSGHIERPNWEDRYLAALVARNEDELQSPALARRLLAELPDNDARRAWVHKAFAAPTLPSLTGPTEAALEG